jgi:hypothetical protein
MAKIIIRVERTPMQRSVEQRASSCTGKIRYKKLGTAKQAAVKLVKEKSIKDPMSVYTCEFCGGWHVGNSTKVILARLRLVAQAG